jgi:hypothetical protein
MTLASVRGGKITAPLRVLLYGVEGVGKSTFAAGAPAPIFLGPEDGTHHLDVQRFPPPESWEEVVEAVRVLTSDPHDFRSLVIDTVDWLEPLVWQQVCDGANVESIEDFGYGKGYVKALDTWRVLLAALERLRAARKLHVVLLAHSQIKTFKNPEGEDFDRYTMKLHDKAGGLLKEWSDCVLFANHEEFAQKDSKTKRVRGISTGVRLIYTQRHAAYDAKNRYDLPESLPLAWEDFAAAVEKREPSDPAKLRVAIEEKIKLLTTPLAKEAANALGRAGVDAVKLAHLHNWCIAKVDWNNVQGTREVQS